MDTPFADLSSSLLGNMLYDVLKAYGASAIEWMGRSRFKQFESVSEFWYVGTDLTQLTRTGDTRIIERSSEKVSIRGHLSPLAPVIPGSPLDSLGMEPMAYLDLSESGAGSQIDGMDVLWNDQVFASPTKIGGRESGFYYAGLYDRFGCADVHLPVYLNDNTKGIDNFLNHWKYNSTGCLATVTGTVNLIGHQELDERLFQYFPQLRELSLKVAAKNPNLAYSERRLFLLQAAEIVLHESIPSSFLGTLWISQRKPRNRPGERVRGMYVNVASEDTFQRANDELRRIYVKSPSSVMLGYSPSVFGSKPPDTYVQFQDRLANLTRAGN